MMQRVVSSTRSFAYVPNFRNYSASIGDVALVAELKECEFFSDGRCLLEAVMTGRHRIMEHYVEEGTQGLHFVRLEPFSDEPVTDAAAREALQECWRVGQLLAEQLMELTAARR